MIRISIDVSELSKDELEKFNKIIKEAFDNVQNMKKMLTAPKSHRKEQTKLIKQLINLSLRDFMFIESAEVGYPQRNYSDYQKYIYEIDSPKINFVIKGC